MNWYLVNVVELTPRNFPWPFPVMKVAARSEAEARQVAALFIIGGLAIESVTELGPVAPGDEEHQPLWQSG